MSNTTTTFTPPPPAELASMGIKPVFQVEGKTFPTMDDAVKYVRLTSTQTRVANKLAKALAQLKQIPPQDAGPHLVDVAVLPHLLATFMRDYPTAAEDLAALFPPPASRAKPKVAPAPAPAAVSPAAEPQAPTPKQPAKKAARKKPAPPPVAEVPANTAPSTPESEPLESQAPPAGVSFAPPPGVPTLASLPQPVPRTPGN